MYLEDGWREVQEPTLLIGRGIKSLRKKRLVSVACARRVLRFVSDPTFARVLIAAEEFTDGRIDWPALLNERKGFRAAARPLASGPRSVFHALEAVRRVTEKETIVFTEALTSASLAVEARAEEEGADAKAAAAGAKEAQFRLMLDVAERAGIRIPPARRTTEVAAIAEAMYASRDFSPMPTLADALVDAGCDDEMVLAHCRSESPHVRSCWVVDLLLGKK